MEEKVISDNHIMFSLQTAMREVCQPMLEYPLIKHVSWIKLYPDGRLQILMCDPQLGLHHLDNGYIIVPNVDLKLIKKNFYYFAFSALNDRYEQALHDYKSLFNINHPIFFFEQYDEYCEIFVFCSGEDNPAVFNFYLNHLDVFENFKSYFKEKAKLLMKEIATQQIYLPEYMRADNLFATPPPLALPEHTAKSTSRSHSLHINGKNITLARRQAEVLQWLGFGHTCKEISKIMGLSHRTIEQYVDHIKMKLELPSKHAVIQCLLKGNHALLKNL